MREYVTIYHPQIGESKVLKSSLNAWLRQGWHEGKAPSKRTSKSAKKTDLPVVEESESSSYTTEAYE